MDSIALISDLHGNLPALEAVLRDIKRRNISRIFCLGDLVGKGPHAEKVVDICQDVCEVTIKGNWDSKKGAEAQYGGNPADPTFPSPQIEFAKELQPVMEIL